MVNHPYPCCLLHKRMLKHRHWQPMTSNCAMQAPCHSLAGHLQCANTLCCICCLAHTVQVNAEPYGSGWMIKVKMSNAGELGDLLDSAAYEKHCDH